MINFEWHEEKEIKNILKHGISFDEAKTLWADENSIEYSDENLSDEERFIRIGFSIKANLLIVVFCEFTNENTIRIISARKATKNERTQYEKRI